jgi:hypothetical protein
MPDDAAIELRVPSLDVPHRKLRGFDHTGVRLLPSRFLDQVEHAAAHYGSISDDSILKGFRREAGLPAPGEDMKGWAAVTSGGIFGQLLSGLARLGRATGNEALLAKARRLFEGWLETLPPDGNARMRPYPWEKLVCGLVDLHVHAGVGEALPVLKRTNDWAARTFDRSRRPADGYDFWGAGPGGTSEWYTLPENLYRAYLLTGDTSFRDFADIWLYDDYWAPFIRSSAPPLVHPVHAYSHVNSFSSAAMAYAVTGREEFLRICINGYDFLQQTQCYATGGFGPEERLMAPDGRLGQSLDLCAAHAEIPCGSWAALKLSRYLMGFTGEARYGDWIETILYNAMGQALPPQSDGHAYYYGNYSMAGGTKQFYWHEWPCCSGTYLQTVADYHDVIYMQTGDGLYVNLFVPSEVTWRKDGRAIRLTQETRYPEAETVTLRIDMDAPFRFALNARVPGWASSASLALNGAPLAVGAGPGHWATVEREWQPGDVLTLRVPLALRLVPVDRQHPDRAAVMFGPIVLAQDEACCRRPFSLGSTTSVEARLVREDEPLRFRIINLVPELHTRYLVPLYAIPGFWPHWVYFDMHAAPLF